MAEADYKSMGIVGATLLGILGIMLGAYMFLEPSQVAPAIATISAVAVPTITSLMSYLKSQEAVAKVSEAAKVGQENKAELKSQTEQLETIQGAVQETKDAIKSQ